MQTWWSPLPDAAALPRVSTVPHKSWCLFATGSPPPPLLISNKKPQALPPAAFKI